MNRTYRSFFTPLLCIFIFTIYDISYGNKRALVLSGGGSRGVAQIGVLRALEEHNLRPDLIVGTSIGALIGGLYAAGIPLDTIEKFFKNIELESYYRNSATRNEISLSQKANTSNYLFELRFTNTFTPIVPNSLSYGQKFFTTLTPTLLLPLWEQEHDFDKLTIPLRIVTTDILTGEKVIFSHGNLPKIIRASCGIPLLFSPIPHNNTLLLDGGLSTNIPVQTAHESGASTVVAIDVTSSMKDKKDLYNPIGMLEQVIAIGVERVKRKERKSAHYIIKPPLEGINNTSFTNIDSIIHIGYVTTLNHIDTLKTLFNNSPPPKVMPPHHKKPLIHKISIHGNSVTTTDFIKKNSLLEVGMTLTSEIIDRAISELYSTDLFNLVTLSFTNDNEVIITVSEKEYWRLRFAVRGDEYHAVEGYVQPAYENLFGIGLSTFLHLQYGYVREQYAIGFNYDKRLNHLFSLNIQGQNYIAQETISKRNEYKDTLNDSTVENKFTYDEMRLKKFGMLSVLGVHLNNNLLLDGVIRLERFQITKSKLSAFNDPIGKSFKEGVRYLVGRLRFDNLDRLPFPTKGHRHSIIFGGASDFMKEQSFIKASINNEYFITLKDRHTLEGGTHFLWANQELPDIEKVYLGGMENTFTPEPLTIYHTIPFMGLQRRSLSGDILLLFRFAYRFSLAQNFYLHSTINWGYTWDQGNSLFPETIFKFNKKSAERFISKAPIGLGLSMSWNTFVGPISVGWGKVIVNSSTLKKDFNVESDNAFYFSAGYDF